MQGRQFPIISNSATTGHKLQGATLENLYITTWLYGKNWVYVVLSRVTSLDGLFLKEPLVYNMEKYKQNEEMAAMIRDLKEHKSCWIPTREEYEEILTQSQEGMPIEAAVYQNEDHTADHNFIAY